MGRIRTVEPLARTGSEELELARVHRDELIVAARTLVAAAGHHPDLAHCADAGCGLTEVTAGPELCALAQRLAGLPPAAEGPEPVADAPLPVAATTFRDMLTGALDAVRTCRQTVHGNGGCWFAAVPDADGCAQILRLAHRLG